MKRSALILAALAVTLTLAGCGSRSIGNKIDDQFLGPEVASRISNAHSTCPARLRASWSPAITV